MLLTSNISIYFLKVDNFSLIASEKLINLNLHTWRVCNNIRVYDVLHTSSIGISEFNLL